MKKITLIVLLALIQLCGQAQTVTDIDGNVYQTVTIGTQTWMAENLKTTHFNNGKAIPTTLMAINNDTNAVYQWIYDDDTLNLPVYGRLYTWYVASHTCNVCPLGWHVPTEAEWVTMINHLGGDSIAGASLKDTGTTHWTSTNSTITNSSGFTARPGGFRGNPLGYTGLGGSTTFWSSSPFGAGGFARGKRYSLFASSNICTTGVAVGNNGNSIRCIKDQSIGLHEKSLIDFKVFPNPAKGRIHIIYDHTPSAKIRIIDIHGKVVFKESISKGSNILNINPLPAGIYYLHLHDSDNNATQKLIKL